MKTRHSIRFILLLTIIGILILGLIIFGFSILYDTTIIEFDLTGIFGGLIFVWMGLGYLVLMIDKIKIIEIKDNIFIIRKPLINIYHECSLKKLYVTKFKEEMAWNTITGILIKLDNGNIEKISIKEYSNSKELIEIITKTCDKDDTLTINIWTQQLKIFLLSGLTILIVFLISQMV